MSFETKLVNLVNKIYKNCVFRDRNGFFRKYSLESRVQLIPNIFAKEVEGFNHPPFKGSIQAELKFSDDEPRAQETYEFFKKHRNVTISVYQYHDYEDYKVIYEPIDLCTCYDKLFGLGFDINCTDMEDFEKKIAKLYLTHDIMLYDDSVKNNPGFVALAEHGFQISHNFKMKSRAINCDVVELTPGRLREFFEDVYDKVDEVAKNPLYEEYKKYVINEIAERAIKNHNGNVNVDIPSTNVYDFISWKRLVWDAARELERRTANAQKYIDLVQNRVKEKMESDNA